MRIIVSDTGLIWNHENPFLEKYKTAVTVVCLDGKPVTDKYNCFISPYKHVGMGNDQFGTQSQRYLALESVANELNSAMNYHDDIIFLADGNPETLYPFFVLKDRNKHNNLHLCAMSPWRFETKSRISAYKYLLSDLSSLQSFLYIDGNQIFDSMDQEQTFPNLVQKTMDDYGKMLPRILTGINRMDWEHKYFFDFTTMSYIAVDEGFDGIDTKAKIEEINDIDFDISPVYSTLGKAILQPSYPVDVDEVREEVEKMPVRVDGKRICNLLREKRIQLAEVNGISFESAECPSIGACAGTCPKCDEELRYLQQELEKIPEDKRIYPQFNVTEEA